MHHTAVDFSDTVFSCSLPASLSMPQHQLCIGSDCREVGIAPMSVIHVGCISRIPSRAYADQDQMLQVQVFYSPDPISTFHRPTKPGANQTRPLTTQGAGGPSETPEADVARHPRCTRWRGLSSRKRGELRYSPSMQASSSPKNTDSECEESLVEYREGAGGLPARWTTYVTCILRSRISTAVQYGLP